MADIIEETLARHPRSGIAYSTYYASLLYGIFNKRHNTFCGLTLPTISTYEHKSGIVVGNSVKSIVGQDAETADGLNRLHRLCHNLVLILWILLHRHSVRTQRLSEIRQFVFRKLRKQYI